MIFQIYNDTLFSVPQAMDLNKILQNNNWLDGDIMKSTLEKLTFDSSKGWSPSILSKGNEYLYLTSSREMRKLRTYDSDCIFCIKKDDKYKSNKCYSLTNYTGSISTLYHCKNGYNKFKECWYEYNENGRWCPSPSQPPPSPLPLLSSCKSYSGTCDSNDNYASCFKHMYSQVNNGRKLACSTSTKCKEVIHFDAALSLPNPNKAWKDASNIEWVNDTCCFGVVSDDDGSDFCS